jgi:hypothetical protein
MERIKLALTWDNSTNPLQRLNRRIALIRLHTAEVTGSIPVAPTLGITWKRRGSCPLRVSQKLLAVSRVRQGSGIEPAIHVLADVSAGGRLTASRWRTLELPSVGRP